VSETTETLEIRENERSKVESWRLHVLIEAGYPLPLAERRGDQVDPDPGPRVIDEIGAEGARGVDRGAAEGDRRQVDARRVREW